MTSPVKNVGFYLIVAFMFPFFWFVVVMGLEVLFNAIIPNIDSEIKEVFYAADLLFWITTFINYVLFIAILSKD